MLRLERFGYREQDILGHTLAWLHHAVAFHEKAEVTRLRAEGRLMLQAALASGLIAGGAEGAKDAYEEMVARLADENEDTGGDAWLLNPNAKTDMSNLTSLTAFLAQKDKERQ